MKRVWFIAVLPLVLFSALALAENPSSLAPSANEITIMNKIQPVVQQYQEKLEERVRKVLGKQIEDARFILYVNIAVDQPKLLRYVRGNVENSKISLLTLPQDITSDERANILIDKLTPELLAGFVKSIKVGLTVDNSISADQAESLKKVVTGLLDLKTARGDVVDVSKGSLVSSSVSEQLDALNKQLIQAKADLLKAESQRQLTEVKAKEEQNNGDLKLQDYKQSLENREKELQDIKDKKEQAEKEIKKLEQSLNDLKDQNSSVTAPLGDLRKTFRGLELPLTLLPIAFFMLMIFGIFGYLFHRGANIRSKNLMEGLQSLAAAFQKSNQRGFSREGDGPLGGGNGNKALDGGGPDPAEFLAGENVLELKEEAAKAWEGLSKSPYTLGCCLKDWLTDEEGFKRFVGFSNALDGEKCKQIWSWFSAQEMTKLQPYLYNMVPKAQCYSFLTQMERRVLKERSYKPDFIEQAKPLFLLQMTDQELATLLDKEALPMVGLVLLAVSSERASRLLEQLRNHSPKDVVLQIKASLQLASDEAKIMLEELQLRKNEQAPPSALGTEHIVSLLEQAGPKTMRLLNTIFASDSDLAEQMRSRIFTFEDVLRLDREFLTEMMEPLSAEQVAVLLVGLDKAAIQTLVSYLSPKMRTDAQLEFNRLRSKPSLLKRAQMESLDMQSEFINRLKELINQGLVEAPQAPQRREAA